LTEDLAPQALVFFSSKFVDGRDKRAFTPVFDGLCPAMTKGMSIEDKSD
jgi:hypothetical protein